MKQTILTFDELEAAFGQLQLIMDINNEHEDDIRFLTFNQEMWALDLLSFFKHKKFDKINNEGVTFVLEILAGKGQLTECY